ncbi:MAG TPA: VWA domain-containing protein [Bryobacteraceae bacterium]|nr:VWA domain-containing protein [Bryobacteraceae bacterium]
MGFSRRDVLRAAALVPAARLMGWQEPEAKYSTGVNVVNVFAAVHDKQGKVVKNLLKDDFTIEEDGRPQTIKYFSQQSDLPLTLGLLVDTSGSQRRVLDEERRASYAFFDQVLRPDRDKAFLIHFDAQVELLQDLTSSRDDLRKALDDLGSSGPQLNRRNQGGGYPPGAGRGQQRGGGGTLLYDAVFLASNEIMRKEQGRKAVILLSDGVDNGSKTSLEGGIEAAQRADTLFYSIRFYDPNAYRAQTPFGNGPFGGGPYGGRRRAGGYPGGGYPGGSVNRPDGKKVLVRIAEETGGAYNEVSEKDPLNKIYARIEDELRSQYSLGYSSDRPGAGYRSIKVGVKLKNLTVQARQGYYARGT